MYEQSPIRISSDINIPEIRTPFVLKENGKESAKEGKSIILIKKRAEVLALKDQQRLEQALEKIKGVIEQYPNDIRSFQIKGELNFSLKMYEQAAHTYENLIDLTNSENELIVAKNNKEETIKSRAFYFFNYGLCLQKLNRHQQAIESFKKAKQINKNKVEIYFCLAQSYRALGEFEKVYKIYEKLVEKNPKKSQYLLKILKICTPYKQSLNVMKVIEKGINYWKGTKSQESDKVLFALYFHKGEVYKIKGKYQQAIQCFIEAVPLVQQRGKIWNQIAMCYDNKGDLQNSYKFYKQILELNPNDTHTINNFANICIRRSQFQEAINILSKGIIFTLSLDSIDQFLLVLLRCHRVMAYTKLNRIDEASKDLSDIVESMEGRKLIEMRDTSEWDNYKFVKYIVQKYKTSISQLNQLKEEGKEEIKQEVQVLEKELVCSISDRLSFKEEGQIGQEPKEGVNLQKLQGRIDRLYNQILTLKQKTLKEHEENTTKVHMKIQEISTKLAGREQCELKLQLQLKELKKQNQTIFNIVDQYRKNQHSELRHIINTLKQNNKTLVAIYIQKMYWIFNSYLIAIRLIANNLVPHPTHLHASKISSFFTKFKAVFQTLSNIPHIGMVCEAITTIISFYLSQESKYVYNILNKIITKHYLIEKDIHSGLQEALINLSHEQYIESTINQAKSNSIAKEMKKHHRAYTWFKNTKNKMIHKMLRMSQVQSNPDEKLIEDLVIEDVSAVLVYLVKNSSCFLAEKETHRNVLQMGVRETLVKGFKKDEIDKLYSRQNDKETSSNMKGEGCTKCEIYKMQEVPRVEVIRENIKNEVMDELIKDAIKENDLQLFKYAISNLTFDFK